MPNRDMVRSRVRASMCVRVCERDRERVCVWERKRKKDKSMNVPLEMQEMTLTMSLGFKLIPRGLWNGNIFKS